MTDAARAALVRDALRTIAGHWSTHATDAGPLRRTAECEDAVLAKLGRMLKA